MTNDETKEIVFNRIGGWLVLPAFLHPVVSVWQDAAAAIESISLLQTSMPTNSQIYFGAMAAAYTGLCLAWLVTFYLAVRVDKNYPAVYIGVAATDFIVGIAVIAVAVGAYSVSLTPKEGGEIARSFISICIWIPYMLVSKRVKATFYNIPMPQNLAFKNVNSPLKQAVMERKQARESSEKRDPLNMVQRAGMVLYWAGSIIAALLTAAGLFALVNATEQFVAFAIIACAAVCWLVGRALKYVLVGS
jgi:hypothetical protein